MITAPALATPPAFFKLVGDVVGTGTRADAKVDVALHGTSGSPAGYTSLDAATGALSNLTAKGEGTAGVLRHDDRYFGVDLLSLEQGAKQPNWSPFALKDLAGFQAAGDPAQNDQLVALVDGKQVTQVRQEAIAGNAKAVKRMTSLIENAFPAAKITRTEESPNTLFVDMRSSREKLLAETAFQGAEGLTLEFTTADKSKARKPLTFGDLADVLDTVPHVYFEATKEQRAVPLSEDEAGGNNIIWAAAQRDQDLWLSDVFSSDFVAFSDEPVEM